MYKQTNEHSSSVQMMKLHQETDAHSANTLETYVCLVFACQEYRTVPQLNQGCVFMCNISSSFTNDLVICWIQYISGCRNARNMVKEKQINSSNKFGDKALASHGMYVPRNSEKYLPFPKLMIKQPPNILNVLSLLLVSD